MSKLSITWKVSLLSTAILTTILLLFTAFTYLSLSAWMISQQKYDAATLARHIAIAYPNSVEGGSGSVSDAGRNWLAQFVSGSQTVYVISLSGRVIDWYGMRDTPGPVPVSLTRADSAARVISFGTAHFVRAVSTSRGESGSASAFIVVYVSVDTVFRYIETLMRILLVGSAGAVLLAGAGGYMVSFLALRPVGRIIRTVRKMDYGHMNERLPELRGRDEIAELTDTFNDLLERIQHAVEKQNQFVADASHEFRSPLTVIEGYANLLGRWGAQDSAVLPRGIEEIKKEAARLRRLTNNLLQLAAIPSVEVTPVPHFVQSTIFEVVQQLSDVHQRTIALDVQDAALKAAISPEHLHQIVSIILHNAIKYTPDERSIRVVVMRSGRQIEITVNDEGCGIPADKLPNIFDRFYRVDQSRDRKTEGFGLGLPIAKELVSAYGGSIRVASQMGMGTTVTVRLPAAL